MRRLGILLLLILTLGWVQPPEMPVVPPLWELVDTQQPDNPNFAPHRSLRYWWTVLPWLYGGSQWWNMAGKPATLTNMTSSGSGWSSDAQGWFAGRLLFDGTDDYTVTTGLLGSPATISVSVVVSTNSGASGTANQFFGIGDYVGIDVTTADQLETYYYAGGSTWNSRFVSWGRNSTGWHHIVFVLVPTSTGNQTTYIDGVQVDQLTGVFSAIVYSGQGTDTYFGKHGNASSRFLHGAIADVRVWDRDLTAAEVWQVYSDILDRCRMALQRRAARLLGAPMTGNFMPGLFE